MGYHLDRYSNSRFGRTALARRVLIRAALAVCLGGAALPAAGQPTPGEAGQLLVTGYDRATGELSLSFEPACASAGHHIEFGPLLDVGFHGYSGQDCALGAGGSYSHFDPGVGSWFFVVIGNDGDSVEGSYGTYWFSRELRERPEDLLDPVCAFDQDLTRRCDGPVVPQLQLTAYRPQSEGYGSPFGRRAVPQELQLDPGVGIRINGDDDDNDGTADGLQSSVAGENDLIELVLTVDPIDAPEGQEYLLRRSDANLLVWSDPSKIQEVMGAADEIVLTFTSATKSFWIENPGGGEADLEFLSRDLQSLDTIAVDAAHFVPFSSDVIALGGESQGVGDPPPEPDNYGTFVLAIELYELGYDVHMYDEDVVSSSGAGVAYDEVVSAIQHRGVTSVAIYGYSHGAGSTYDMSKRLNDNRGAIGSFSIDYTAYTDAIQNDSDFDLDTETRLPPSTGYHANYYENPGCGFLSLCGGPVAGADFDLDVNTTPWGAGLGHFTIDDASEVLTGLRDQLLQQLSP